MATHPRLCINCKTILRSDERHSCSSYTNDEIPYKIRQPDETKEMDTNRGETTEHHADILEDNNRNMCETVQQIANASKASTSRANFFSSTENKEQEGGLFEESMNSTDRPFSQNASFQFSETMEILDAGADRSLELIRASDSVPVPSTIRHQTIGPDGMKVDVCSYQSKKKSNFDDHYRRHTEEKDHVCGFCGKLFSRKGNLKVHERIHTGEKPFKCDICNKRFGYKKALDSHLRTHTSERPYSCVVCGKNFGKRKPLDAHLKLHMGEWLLHGSGKSFSERETLDIPLRRHSVQNPSAFPICERTSYDHSDLERQVATHGQEPYKCGQCAQTFSCNEDRNRHFMQQHM